MCKIFSLIPSKKKLLPEKFELKFSNLNVLHKGLLMQNWVYLDWVSNPYCFRFLLQLQEKGESWIKEIRENKSTKLQTFAAFLETRLTKMGSKIG